MDAGAEIVTAGHAEDELGPQAAEVRTAQNRPTQVRALTLACYRNLVEGTL